MSVSTWPSVHLEDIVVDGPTNGYSPPAAADGRGTLSLKLSATTQGRLVLNETTIKRLHETIPTASSLWLSPGDLLVQRSNTAELVGTAAIYDGPPDTYIYPDLMMRLRFRDPATTRWIWRYLNSSVGRRYLTSVAAGAAGSMPKISGAKLRAMPLPLPPLEEQRRIADILDKADAIRRKRKEAIALTEQLLRSTFLEMFGDPVTNPKGWDMQCLRDICESKQYGTAEKCNSEERGLPVVRMNNISYTGGLDLTDLKWAELAPKEAEKLSLRSGDVLFNRVNSRELVGKTGVWHDEVGYTFAGYLIRLRAHPEIATGQYLSMAMNTTSMKRVLFNMAKPSINMANISGSDLDRIHLSTPPLHLQKQFAALQAQLNRTVARQTAAIAASEALLNALTDMLLSRNDGSDCLKRTTVEQLRLFEV